MSDKNYFHLFLLYLFNNKIFNFILIFDKLLINIYKLNIILITISFLFFLFFLVFLLLSIFFHRKKLKLFKYFFFENIIFELNLLFFFFSFIFLISIISTFILININNYSCSYITVKIVGYQWKWYCNYLNGLGKKINFFSFICTDVFSILNYNLKKNNYIIEVDKNLVLPVKQDIRLILISNDVIHSLFFPSLMLKQDALPNFYRDIYFFTNRIGKYRGYCTELCGKNHSYMPIVINILPFLEYKKWVLSKYIEKFLKNNY